MIATGTTIVIAIGLFALKKRLGLVLAIIEIIGGSATIYYSFGSNFDNDVLYVLAIASGLFLVINGLDNYVKLAKRAKANTKKKIESNKINQNQMERDLKV